MKTAVTLLTVAAALVGTTGCVLGEQVTSRFDPSLQSSPAAQGRFQQLASASDLGYGVVPNPSGLSNSVWLGMGDRLCAMNAASGAIAIDIFVDGDIAPGVVLLDADADGFLAVGPDGSILVTDSLGQVTDSYPVDGEVIAGQQTDDGIVLLVLTEDGCFVVRIHPDGTQELVQVEDDACDPHTDLVDTTGSMADVVIGGADSLVVVGDVGVVDVDEGDQAAVDSETGRFYAATTGTSAIRAHLPGRSGGIQSFALPGPLVDFDVQAGHLVALTTDHDLVHLDALTGETLAIEPYFGPLGIDRLQFTTDEGTGIVLSNGNALQFYALRKNRAPAGGAPDAAVPGPTVVGPGTATGTTSP
jgi:hypothetical protein